MIKLYTKVHMNSANGSLVIAIELEAKGSYGTATLLLFYIPKNAAGSS
jgi:hypothetical protein